MKACRIGFTEPIGVLGFKYEASILAVAAASAIRAIVLIPRGAVPTIGVTSQLNFTEFGA